MHLHWVFYTPCRPIRGPPFTSDLAQDTGKKRMPEKRSRNRQYCRSLIEQFDHSAKYIRLLFLLAAIGYSFGGILFLSKYTEWPVLLRLITEQEAWRCSLSVRCLCIYDGLPLPRRSSSVFATSERQHLFEARRARAQNGNEEAFLPDMALCIGTKVERKFQYGGDKLPPITPRIPPDSEYLNATQLHIQPKQNSDAFQNQKMIFIEFRVKIRKIL